MKKLLLLAVIFGFCLIPVYAQFGMGSSMQGPQIDGAMNKLFGDAKFFSAQLEMETGSITMPGKFNFDNGKSRFELNLSSVKGAGITPDAAQQLKTFGMETTVFISRPDRRLAYMIYPGLGSYAEVASPDTVTNISSEDFKIETADIGDETVDGHDCAKKKATVTDKDGAQHEFTIWNAKDLKNFPVKITTSESGRSTLMRFKDVAFTKPAASLFEAPSGLTKYDNIQTMLQTEMMKKMTGQLHGN